jgi:hypothetical protein
MCCDLESPITTVLLKLISLEGGTTKIVNNVSNYLPVAMA